MFRYPDKPILASESFLNGLDENWIAEPKLDGYRCYVIKTGGNIDFVSRHNKRLDVNKSIRSYFQQFKQSFIIDCEWINDQRIKAINTEFSKNLKMHEAIGVFDIVRFNEEWITSKPLVERRDNEILKSISICEINEVLNHSIFRLPSRNGKEALNYFNEQKNYLISEGIVVKKLNSKLICSSKDSANTNSWFKIKYRNAK